MSKKNRLNKINDALEIPKEVYTKLPLITIIGFEETVIENIKGILDYEEFFIRINTEIGIVSINGFNLDLKNISENKIKIKGIIEKIEIEEIN